MTDVTPPPPPAPEPAPAPYTSAPSTSAAYAATPYSGAPAGPKTNTLAIVSLVLAFFISLGAIICGHIALNQIKQTGEGGRGLAIAGLVLGYLGFVAGFFLVIVAFVFPFLVIGSAGGFSY